MLGRLLDLLPGCGCIGARRRADDERRPLLGHGPAPSLHQLFPSPLTSTNPIPPVDPFAPPWANGDPAAWFRRPSVASLAGPTSPGSRSEGGGAGGPCARRDSIVDAEQRIRIETISRNMGSRMISPTRPPIVKSLRSASSTPLSPAFDLGVGVERKPSALSLPAVSVALHAASSSSEGVAPFSGGARSETGDGPDGVAPREALSASVVLPPVESKSVTATEAEPSPAVQQVHLYSPVTDVTALPDLSTASPPSKAALLQDGVEATAGKAEDKSIETIPAVLVSDTPEAELPAQNVSVTDALRLDLGGAGPGALTAGSPSDPPSADPAPTIDLAATIPLPDDLSGYTPPASTPTSKKTSKASTVSWRQEHVLPTSIYGLDSGVLPPSLSVSYQNAIEDLMTPGSEIEDPFAMVQQEPRPETNASPPPTHASPRSVRLPAEEQLFLSLPGIATLEDKTPASAASSDVMIPEDTAEKRKAEQGFSASSPGVADEPAHAAADLLVSNAERDYTAASEDQLESGNVEVMLVDDSVADLLAGPAKTGQPDHATNERDPTMVPLPSSRASSFHEPDTPVYPV